jgi:hypothetical protein
VIDYIGLASNVSTYTDAQFVKHLREDVMGNLAQTMQAALRERDRKLKERVMATAQADPELRKLT